MALFTKVTGILAHRKQACRVNKAVLFSYSPNWGARGQAQRLETYEKFVREKTKCQTIGTPQNPIPSKISDLITKKFSNMGFGPPGALRGTIRPPEFSLHFLDTPRDSQPPHESSVC